MNVSLSVAEAESLARQFFRQNHRVWPRPLVYVLEQSQAQLSLKWAIRLYHDFLVDPCQPEPSSHYKDWLDGLMGLVGRSDVAEYCDRFAHDTWSRHRGMSVLDRGIARLYWALKNFLQRLTDDYYFQVTSAVGMLSDRGETLDLMDESVLDSAVKLCRCLIDSSNDS